MSLGIRRVPRPSSDAHLVGPPCARESCDRPEITKWTNKLHAGRRASAFGVAVCHEKTYRTSVFSHTSFRPGVMEHWTWSGWGTSGVWITASSPCTARLKSNKTKTTHSRRSRLHVSRGCSIEWDVQWPPCPLSWLHPFPFWLTGAQATVWDISPGPCMALGSLADLARPCVCLAERWVRLEPIALRQDRPLGLIRTCAHAPTRGMLQGCCYLIPAASCVLSIANSPEFTR